MAENSNNLIYQKPASGLELLPNAPALKLIDAETDVSAVRAWLSRYADVATTSANYEKELDRLLLWAASIGKVLAELSYDDFMRYMAFLRNPQPADVWVSKHRCAKGTPGWRPFSGPLSEASLQQALRIINSCLSWLVDARYLQANPLRLVRKSRESTPTFHQDSARYLSKQQWSDVKAAIEAIPQDTDTSIFFRARARWIFSLLYLTALRLSEMTQASMGQLYLISGSDGVSRWWLRIRGKGNKIRQIPIGEELLVELKAYRRVNDLPELPSYQELTPLVLPLRVRELPDGEVKHLTRGAAHATVKKIFEIAVDWVRAHRPDDLETISALAKASTHWLRHTAGTHMAQENIPITVVRDNFGHSSLATTSKYLHTEADTRHDATVNNHKANWGSK